MFCESIVIILYCYEFSHIIEKRERGPKQKSQTDNIMGCASSNSSAPKGNNSNNAPRQNAVSTPERRTSTASKSSRKNLINSIFLADYDIAMELGRGSFSSVRAATRRSDGEQVAIKIVAKANLEEEDEDSLRLEVAIMRECDHPNIVKIYDFGDEPTHYFLVLEQMAGGELFDRLIQKAVYTEKEARELATDLLKTLKYLHDKNIVHRDLKPENLLLTSKTDDITCKIADFGFATKLGGPIYHVNAGTPAYVAPEIIDRKEIGTPTDMWAFGVILFMLLGGYPPFFEDDEKEMFDKISRAEYVFESDCWANISPEAVDLIKNILVVDQKQRYTADQALGHAWFNKDSSQLIKCNLNKNMMLLKSYKSSLFLRATTAAATAVVEAIRSNSNARIGDAIEAIRKTSSASISQIISQRQPSFVGSSKPQAQANSAKSQ